MDPNALTRYEGNVSALVIMLHLAGLGITPETGGPLGFTKAGRPIYPIAGGDDAGLEAKIDALTREIAELRKTRDEAHPGGTNPDAGRDAAAQDGAADVAAQLAELAALKAAQGESAAKASRKAEIDAAIQDFLKSQTGQSLAAQVGNPGWDQKARSLGMVPASPLQKAIFGDDYASGEAFTAIADFKNLLTGGLDVAAATRGKAWLDAHTFGYMGAPDMSTGKATLGTTGATGGYVLPNNLVDTLVKPNTQAAIYRSLVTVVPGVAVRGVDQPYRLGAPSRMTYANWGATKENVDETYGSYSANLVTFARIMDIAKQYMRFSAGAAERDVLDELAKAADLAENYEVIAGPGSGTVGSGDACLGIYTSLNATPTWLGVKGAKTGAASNSTIAGSFAQAIVEIVQILAGRNRRPTAVVVDATTYFTALGQGSDTAGFWSAPDGPSQGFAVDRLTGGLTYWGIPILYDTNLGTNATTKIAIAAEWNAFKLYRGMEFRIDSSDQAGDRWDKNLIGFRGEMEMGFNAETGVHVGAAQLMTAVIP